MDFSGLTANQTAFLLSINKTNFNETEMLDFLNTLIREQPIRPSIRPHLSQDDCLNFCNGLIRELLLDYKSYHGYISLMVCKNCNNFGYQK